MMQSQKKEACAAERSGYDSRVSRDGCRAEMGFSDPARALRQFACLYATYTRHRGGGVKREQWGTGEKGPTATRGEGDNARRGEVAE